MTSLESLRKLTAAMSDSHWVAGVDGCRGGWIAALRPIDMPAQTELKFVSTFAELLVHDQLRIIAVDIPIGLPQQTGLGGRLCDVEGRRPLGARQSAVFSVPSRATIGAESYGAACEQALLTSDPPRKVSKQTFNLFAKIREVDALMTPALQQRVVECHPERSFVAMTGGASLIEPKKVKSQPYEPGLAVRRTLLMAAGYQPELFKSGVRQRTDCSADDVIDAVAASWTAARIAQGVASRVPLNPPTDAHGLRMEIWF